MKKQDNAIESARVSANHPFCCRRSNSQLVSLLFKTSSCRPWSLAFPLLQYQISVMFTYLDEDDLQISSVEVRGEI